MSTKYRIRVHRNGDDASAPVRYVLDQATGFREWVGSKKAATAYAKQFDAIDHGSKHVPEAVTKANGGFTVEIREPVTFAKAGEA